MFCVLKLYSCDNSVGLTFICQDDEVECSNGFCVDKSAQCDGYNDCLDFSDELGCRMYTVERFYDIPTIKDLKIIN